MGVWSVYFSAPSDEAAARVLAGDPLGLPDDVLQSGNIIPHYHLEPVEVFLTGRNTEAVRAGPPCETVAAIDDEGVGVVTVSDELMAALAAADSGQLAEAAVSWSQFPDFQGTDTSGLAGFLSELAALARRAAARKEHLYCLLGP